MFLRSGSLRPVDPDQQPRGNRGPLRLPRIRPSHVHLTRPGIPIQGGDSADIEAHSPEFLQNEFENWNFLANLPNDIPGVEDSIASGEGMVSYIESVADNYRYYIGTGSRHTMYGSDKVYTEQSGGESQTIVDWVSDVISFDLAASNPNDWQNVECSDCGIVLPGDPTPPVIPTDPFYDDMGQTVIVCSQ